MKNQLIFSAAVLILLSGCSAPTSVMVRYDSSPSGATLTLNDSNSAIPKPIDCPEGSTPKACTYELTEAQLKQPFVTVPGAKVKWASGATAESTDLKVSTQIIDLGLIDVRKGLDYTFQHPAGYPRLQMDKEVEEKLRQERLQLEAHQQRERARQVRLNTQFQQQQDIRQYQQQRQQQQQKQQQAIRHQRLLNRFK